MINSVTFGAKRIGTVKILKRKGEHYVPYDADLVKLNINRRNDIRNLISIQDSWNTFLAYRLFDLCTALDLHIFNRKYVILLSEPQKYGRKDNLNPNKILGISLFIERPLNRYNKLEILQTNPKYKFGINNRKFTDIGQCLLNFLKKNFSKKPFKLTSSNDARGFYINNGLKIKGNDFVWG